MKKLKVEPEKVWGCWSFLNEQDKSAEPRLPRGVWRVFGSNQSNGLPQYAATHGLSWMSGEDPARLDEIGDKKEQLHVMAWGMDAHEHSVLPKRRMTLDSFGNWACERHKENGEPLKDALRDATKFDWYFTIGCYNYLPDGKGPKAWCKRLWHRRSGKTRDLPPNFVCKVEDLGSVFILKSNWFDYKAKIINRTNGTTMKPCKVLFRDVASKVKSLIVTS